MKDSSFKFGAIKMLLLGVVFPVTGSLVLRLFLSDWRWVHEPIHSVTEAFGAFAALTLAALLLLLRKHEKDISHNLWVASALVGMGLLDGFHASVPTGVSFVWLHSTATLAGGCLFAMVWLPDRMARSRLADALPTAAALGAGTLGVFSVAFSNALPVMVSQGAFTPTAIGMNLMGGLFFLMAAAHFAIRYKSYGRFDNFLYANLCLLFGSAGLLSSSCFKPSVASLVAPRNSLIALPSERPSSGNRAGPKISNATTTIMRICSGLKPNMVSSFHTFFSLSFQRRLGEVYFQDCSTEFSRAQNVRQVGNLSYAHPGRNITMLAV